MSGSNSDPDWSVFHTLLEKAILDQRAIERATQAMDSAAALLRDLPGKLVTEVSGAVERKLESASQEAANKIVERFDRANVEADRACLAYERAAKFAPIRFAFLAVIVFGCGLLGMLAVAWFVLPNFQTITLLRKEQADLEATISSLAQRGGRIETSQCSLSNGALKFCIRVEESYGAFKGEHGEEFRVPYGY